MQGCSLGVHNLKNKGLKTGVMGPLSLSSLLSPR